MSCQLCLLCGACEHKHACVYEKTRECVQCVLRECPRAAWEPAGQGQGRSASGALGRRQLQLNNDIARLVRTCTASMLGAPEGGGKRAAAIVAAGLVSRLQVDMHT